jgi:hypothetical protein
VYEIHNCLVISGVSVTVTTIAVTTSSDVAKVKVMLVIQAKEMARETLKENIFKRITGHLVMSNMHPS